MQYVNALSLTSAVNDWLTNSRHPRILHYFDRACNLINERKEVCSIVTPQIGNGPFNLVIEGDVLFSDHLHAESSISICASRLTLGDLSINTANAKLWLPRPDWETLHAKRDDIFNNLSSLRASNSKRSNPIAMTAITNFNLPNSLISNLSSALATADIPLAQTISSQLAGLGIGLTPAGDDFILGAMYASWIIHAPEIASVLANEITNTAASLTTSLSGAWLRSVGRGEAGILWHNFFDALISTDPERIQETKEKIFAIGETSGADALAGFIGVFMCWMVYKELATNEDPPC